jgi:hypothetical protein
LFDELKLCWFWYDVGYWLGWGCGGLTAVNCWFCCCRFTTVGSWLGWGCGGLAAIDCWFCCCGLASIDCWFCCCRFTTVGSWFCCGCCGLMSVVGRYWISAGTKNPSGLVGAKNWFRSCWLLSNLSLIAADAVLSGDGFGIPCDGFFWALVMNGMIKNCVADW